MNSEIAQMILEVDASDYRFEQFCCAVCSKEHGVEFLPTSASWDRGRDGRSGARSNKSHRNILCATLNRDIDAKVEADLLRVTSTSSPEHLIYCSSQALSEDKCDDITKTIKRHAPSGSLTVYGAIQLGKLAEKYGEIFEKYYRGELDSVRAALERKPNDEESKRGLRLALLTTASDDSAYLRSAILKRSALEVIADQGRVSASTIANVVSKDLGLPRPVSQDVFSTILTEEERAGLVKRTVHDYELTAEGKKYLQTIPVPATEFLLKGKISIRAKLETLIGHKLAEKQFERLWSTLTDFLSVLFYQNGLEIVVAIDAFLRGESTTCEGDIRQLLKDGARRVAIAASSSPENQQVLETAILDMFVERDGPAFDWLTRVCERFVVLCCLGLEANTAQQIKETLVRNDVVLDSDIILNYLCSGGREHAVVDDLLERWRALGGRILLAPVVLEEVAYHAWISQNDFRETRHLFGKLRGDERRRYITNAFVNAFHAVGKHISQWDLFISQYRGNSSGDYTKIRNLLRVHLGAELLPDSYDETLAKEITEYLRGTEDEDSELTYFDEDAEYKRNRDGHLLASLGALRTAAGRLASHSHLLLLTSSSELRRAEHKFSEQLGGQPPMVLNRASFAYLLSLLPGVAVGSDTLRRAMFDFGSRARLQDDERRALRIIRGAEVYDLPWAERGLLYGQMNKAYQAEASRRGVHEQELKRKLKTHPEPETSAVIMSEALRQLAKKTTSEEELQEAKNRIKHLEEELIAAKAAAKRAGPDDKAR